MNECALKLIDYTGNNLSVCFSVKPARLHVDPPCGHGDVTVQTW